MAALLAELALAVEAAAKTGDGSAIASSAATAGDAAATAATAIIDGVVVAAGHGRAIAPEAAAGAEGVVAAAGHSRAVAAPAAVALLLAVIVGVVAGHGRAVAGGLLLRELAPSSSAEPPSRRDATRGARPRRPWSGDEDEPQNSDAERCMMLRQETKWLQININIRMHIGTTIGTYIRMHIRIHIHTYA